MRASCGAADVWRRIFVATDFVVAVHFDVVRRQSGMPDHRPANAGPAEMGGGQSGGSAPGGLRKSEISFSKSSIEENDL